jgi:hypothetical protein
MVQRMLIPARKKSFLIRNLPALLFIIFFINNGRAQEIIIQEEFLWSSTYVYTDSGSRLWKVPVMASGSYDPESGIPVWNREIPLQEGEELNLKGKGFWIYSDITDPEEIEFLQKRTSLEEEAGPFSISYTTNRKERSGWVKIPGIIRSGEGHFKRLEFITLNIEKKVGTPSALAKNGFGWKSKSLLAEGRWAKIYVNQNGVYSLSYDYIAALGLPVEGISHSSIRLYGYPAGMLPEANAQTRWDDLEEMAIKILDNNHNGTFDPGDQVLFYGQNPNINVYDASKGSFLRQMHLYSTSKAYFLTIGETGGKRIQSQPSSPREPTYTSGSFDEIIHYESEKVNIISSGKEWFGEVFDRETEYIFREDLPGQIGGENILIQTNASARSGSVSSISVIVNGQTALQHSMDPVYVNEPNSQFASFPTSASASVNTAGPLNIILRYNKPAPSSKAWLNYYSINYRRSLSVSGPGQLVFRDRRGIGPGQVTRFMMQQPEIEVWEVTDPLNISQADLSAPGSNSSFTFESDSLREFAGFIPGQYLQPLHQETIENQDLHSLSGTDYLIISAPEFLNAANRLADFHRSHSNLSVYITTPEKIYNEFSSGTQDISAIRNFIRMLYDKAVPGSEPRYLLLFGDASYDYKNIRTLNSNFVPTFETRNSVSPVGSFCADDYYGLLDEEEGGNIIQGSIDLAIGRLPVQTSVQAEQMVDKIISYHDVSGLGEWRNNIVLFSDDKDGNTHLQDAEIFADTILSEAPVYNLRKVYADAYKRVTVGNGQRYPEVNKEFDRAFNEGSLIVNYSGHGGDVQLGDERFIDIPQINSWRGGNRLPLFVTATCDFTRFDNPEHQSAGELVMLNPQGGAIGMFTTVRIVYSWPNRRLNTNLYAKNAFDYDPDEVPGMGDLFRKMKNKTNADVNNRSFTMLGDPAVKLAYPKHNVVTTSVKVHPDTQEADTLKALSKVTISGEVRKKDHSLLNDFNGKIYATVFGSKQNLKTLGNDPDSYVQEFETFKSIVYKGNGTVENGRFSISFIMPRDLPIEGGFGKISYYAENGSEDANGFELIYMSPEIDPVSEPDVTGPEIRLFMNDTAFVYGGITSEDPEILALVFDESGINTTGLGIGRGITGLLDNNSKNQLLMDNYYTAVTDDFRRGTVRYPLKNLSEGRHTLKVKVWDVHNNSAEAYTEFIVASTVELAVENLLNYPNPFYQDTKFSFEHNQQGKNFSVEIAIYKTDGTLVTTLKAEVENASSKFDNISWDARNKNGKTVTPGTYIYRTTVKTEEGQEVQKSERLVYMP